MKNLSIEALFDRMRKILLNLQEDATLQQRMSVWGFPPERIQEGHALLQAAQEMHTHKDDQYHVWWEMTHLIQQDRKAAMETFIEHVHVARLAFRKHPEILRKLKIKKINHHRNWEWTVQALRFYRLVGAYAPLMQQRGVLPEEMQQARAAIRALLALKDRSALKKGLAEGATRQRNATLDALRAWHVQFRAAARLAFHDNPQRLEAFGMKVPG